MVHAAGVPIGLRPQAVQHLVVRPAGRAEQLRQLAPPGQQGLQHVQAAARRGVRRHVHLSAQPTSRRSVHWEGYV